MAPAAAGAGAQRRRQPYDLGAAGVGRGLLDLIREACPLEAPAVAAAAAAAVAPAAGGGRAGKGGAASLPASLFRDLPARRGGARSGGTPPRSSLLPPAHGAARRVSAGDDPAASAPTPSGPVGGPGGSRRALDTAGPAPSSDGSSRRASDPGTPDTAPANPAKQALALQLLERRRQQQLLQIKARQAAEHAARMEHLLREVEEEQRRIKESPPRPRSARGRVGDAVQTLRELLGPEEGPQPPVREPAGADGQQQPEAGAAAAAAAGGRQEPTAAAAEDGAAARATELPGLACNEGAAASLRQQPLQQQQQQQRRQQQQQQQGRRRAAPGTAGNPRGPARVSSSVESTCGRSGAGAGVAAAAAAARTAVTGHSPTRRAAQAAQVVAFPRAAVPRPGSGGRPPADGQPAAAAGAQPAAAPAARAQPTVAAGASAAPSLGALVAEAQAAAAPPPGGSGAGKRDAKAQEALREFMAKKKAHMDRLLREEREAAGREVDARRAAVRAIAQRQREVGAATRRGWG
jgi:hypothetical protein